MRLRRSCGAVAASSANENHGMHGIINLLVMLCAVSLLLC